MEIYYKGKNIYQEVKVQECIYDSRCDNKLSHLRILFVDDDYKFDSYGFQIGQVIRVKDEKIDTKKMFINKIKPINAGYEITANPIEWYKMQESDEKMWKNVKFKKVINDIANKHGLITQFFGVSNNKYKALSQNFEKDIVFATRMAMLEGCILVIFDGKLIVASRQYIAAQGAADTLEIDEYDVRISEQTKYKKCIVRSEDKLGKYIGKEGSGTLTYHIKVSSIEEGNRFARNLLEHNNRLARTGCVITDEIIDGYSAGTVVRIKSKDHTSINGNAIICRVRHDLAKGKSKLWFECLEE